MIVVVIVVVNSMAFLFAGLKLLLKFLLAVMKICSYEISPAISCNFFAYPNAVPGRVQEESLANLKSPACIPYRHALFLINTVGLIRIKNHLAIVRLMSD